MIRTFWCENPFSHPHSPGFPSCTSRGKGFPRCCVREVRRRRIARGSERRVPSVHAYHTPGREPGMRPRRQPDAGPRAGARFPSRTPIQQDSHPARFAGRDSRPGACEKGFSHEQILSTTIRCTPSPTFVPCACAFLRVGARFGHVPVRSADWLTQRRRDRRGNTTSFYLSDLCASARGFFDRTRT